MAQITLYLDDATQAMVDEAAKANGVSKSRWVADIIRKADAPCTQPADVPRLIY